MSTVVVMGDDRGLVGRLEASAALTVVRHVPDAAELLAVIGSGLATVAVFAGDAASIDAALVESLHRAGGRGVALVAGEADRLRLERWGLSVLPWDAEPAAIEAAVAALWAGEWGRLGVQPPAPNAAPGAPGLPIAPQRGRITTVWGTGGAPGRSTVALNLAVEEALRGQRTVLVDADTHGASLATALGLLDESAGIVRLCRQVDQGGFDPGADGESFARVRAGGAGLRFTSGLPRPERWAEVSGPSLGRALAALASVCDQVIVDVAAPVTRDDELLLDSFAPQRNDATLTAIGAADRLLAVGQADPVSLPRLVRLCEEAATLPAGPPPVVVLNRVRSSVSGTHPERGIRRAWERFGPKAFSPSHFLPSEPAAADAALLRGRALAEAAPRSPLRRAIAALAG
ncbi:AAA family ATPase [Galactobacter valiniphilus]|uniref:AAA family ATPase n=1 Tax=Galactobacter valiniphilus TaxID=2676122 RepID=UPI0037368043